MKIKFPTFDKNHNLTLQELEVQTVKGLPELKILGLQGQESQILKEKLRTAIKFQSFKLMGVRKIVHLKNFKTHIQSFENLEFQLVVMLLIKLKQVFIPTKLPIFFVGKLDLDGKIRPSISADSFQKLLNTYPKTIFITSADYDLRHPNIIKLSELKQLSNIHFQNLNPVELLPVSEDQAQNDPDYIDFEAISDFHLPKFCLTITLLQNSSLLLIGESGIGKSLIFRSLPSLGIPEEDIISLDPSFSVSQFKNMIQALEEESAISKNQSKILVLNELSDYKKTFLEYLKIFFDKIEAQNYKNKYILLASLNPCKCGNLGSLEKQCKCNYFQIKSFENKIPFPILDRFEIVLNLNDKNKEYSFPLLSTFQALKIIGLNPQNQINIQEFEVSPFALDLLETVKIKFAPSKRRVHKIANLAKAIAQASNLKTVSEDHMYTAIQINNYLIQKKALN
jgi:magnesium chelatase family protein